MEHVKKPLGWKNIAIGSAVAVGIIAVITVIVSAVCIAVVALTGGEAKAAALPKPAKNCKVVVTKQDGKNVFTIHDHNRTGKRTATFEGSYKPDSWLPGLKPFKLSFVGIPHKASFGGEVISATGKLNGVTGRGYENTGGF